MTCTGTALSACSSPVAAQLTEWCVWCGQWGRRLTLRALDGVDGLLPARLLLGGSGQAVLLIQVQLEPHSQGIQHTLMAHGQTQPPHLPRTQALQLLKEVIGQRGHIYI